MAPVRQYHHDLRHGHLLWHRVLLCDAGLDLGHHGGGHLELRGRGAELQRLVASPLKPFGALEMSAGAPKGLKNDEKR